MLAAYLVDQLDMHRSNQLAAGTPTARRDPCAACGLCCRSYLVPVFGHDVYRLVKQRNLDPRNFIFICEQEQPDAVGFRLEVDGPTYGLALDKKDKLEVSQPCTFLIEHGDGTSHCGIYEDRPIACATYPMARVADRISFMSAALCPPGAWGTNEPTKHHWALGLRRLARYRDTYVEAVNRWNAWVASTPDRSRPAEHFVAYVLQLYDRLAELDRRVGDDEVAAIEQAWGSLAPDGPAEAPKADEPAWIAYLRQVRDVIDEIFPELPPLAFARIAIARERGEE
jgi:Fe-S-cluster containining protein